MHARVVDSAQCVAGIGRAGPRPKVPTRARITRAPVRALASRGAAGRGALAAALLVLAGCSGDALTSTDSLAPASQSAALIAPGVHFSVAGEWNWSSVEEVAFPPPLAVGLKVVPEGDLTYGTCESAGTMTLVQNGSEVHGTARRDFNACRTRLLNQPFSQPSADLIVADGRLSGRSLRFSFESNMVKPCPHSVVVKAVDGGDAVSLSGQGFCYLPGHPQSESPFQPAPPPQGESRAVSWQAQR